jgi:hypothetical protein
LGSDIGLFAVDAALLVFDTGGIGVPVIPPPEEHAAKVTPIAATSSGVNRMFYEFSFGSFLFGGILSRLARIVGVRGRAQVLWRCYEETQRALNIKIC